MKVLKYALLLWLLPLAAQSQIYVNDININKLDITYCTIDLYGGPLFKPPTYAALNYGQETGSLARQTIQDSTFEPILFNSLPALLNYMEKNGWEYIENLADVDENSTSFSYIFKRKQTASTKMAITFSNHWDCLTFLE